MDAAAEALRPRLPCPVLTQPDLPKPALVARFADDEPIVPVRHHGLLAGRRRARPTLSLVTIDRMPFPRPDDPLLQARRERPGRDAFRHHRPAPGRHAAGPGRRPADPLAATDRGVVAVLDPRLATKPRYRWDIVHALPPMRRTRDRAEVEAFLREITA